VKIYVLRHAIAEPRRPGLAEAKRQVTKEGEEKLARVLATARRAGVAPSLILTSPFLRALRTAELAAEALHSGPPATTEALLPASSPEAVWQEIRAHREERALMLVGHEPLLSRAVSRLLGASWTLVTLRKGALALVEVEEFGDQPRGSLQWLLTAKLAR